MFENAPIGVDDYNGTPIKNGDTLKSIFPDQDGEWRVFYDQDTCSFMLLRLNISYRHVESILSFTMKDYVAAVHVTNMNVKEGG